MRLAVCTGPREGLPALAATAPRLVREWIRQDPGAGSAVLALSCSSWRVGGGFDCAGAVRASVWWARVRDSTPCKSTALARSYAPLPRAAHRVVFRAAAMRSCPLLELGSSFGLKFAFIVRPA